MFTSLNLLCGILQIAHDMNHSLATIFQAQIRLVRILKNVHDGASGIIQALSLSGKPVAVLFVVSQYMNHSLALIGQLSIDVVQITEYMHQSTAPLLTFIDAHLQGLFLL